MDLGIAGRTALVCASTSGLGAATATSLAAEGARVVFTGRRGDRARDLAAEYPGCAAVELDLRTPDEADELYTRTVDAIGAPDILVLNGPGPKPGTATEVDTDAIESAMRSLVLVQQRLVQRSLEHMRDQRWGRILAIGSSGVVAPIAGLALSNIGRAALAGYLKSLATEVAADGITVNLLLPGRVATDRLASLDESTAERTGRPLDQVRHDAQQAIPAGRYGEADEFGAVAAFLCSARAGYVTGTAMRCDGGLVPTL